MHYRGTPLWPFGFGLAYTSFDVSLDTQSTALATTTDAVAQAHGLYYSAQGMQAEPLVPLGVKVRNTGNRTSDVVVLVFSRLVSALPSNVTVPMPLRQLAGFERTSRLRPGEQRLVSVGLAPIALCRVDEDGNRWVEPGDWALAATVDGVSMFNATLSITGNRIQVLSFPGDDSSFSN